MDRLWVCMPPWRTRGICRLRSSRLSAESVEFGRGLSVRIIQSINMNDQTIFVRRRVVHIDADSSIPSKQIGMSPATDDMVLKDSRTTTCLSLDWDSIPFRNWVCSTVSALSEEEN